MDYLKVMQALQASEHLYKIFPDKGLWHLRILSFHHFNLLEKVAAITELHDDA